MQQGTSIFPYRPSWQSSPLIPFAGQPRNGFVERLAMSIGKRRLFHRRGLRDISITLSSNDAHDTPYDTRIRKLHHLRFSVTTRTTSHRYSDTLSQNSSGHDQTTSSTSDTQSSPAMIFPSSSLVLEHSLSIACPEMKISPGNVQTGSQSQLLR
ncbi:hypothetical protein ARMSODRAFT_214487 [Armillaria solidipes]|uniref:Uncharacterized protein n=1 Tax=Armillaria solidipes TaxID=1076256 RepID=A0A2H3BUR1_9AGAR|nr:hypothetical protein ARMSODRAFT_214487 [Armillaria solidipes]